MTPNYKPRQLVDARKPSEVIEHFTPRVARDRRKYALLSIHPSRDLITIVFLPFGREPDLKELHQVAPSFLGARIIGGAAE